MRRADAGLGKGASQLKKDSAAGAVVGSAVVDVVALRVRVDAEMVVVGGIEDTLIRRACSGHAAYDIRADIAADAALDMGVKLDWKLDGMEGAGFAGVVDCLVEVA